MQELSGAEAPATDDSGSAMKKKFYRQTKRLILRPLRASDFKQWLLAYSNAKPRQNKFDVIKKPQELNQKTFQKGLKYLNKKTKNEQHFAYAIFCRKSGAYIGRCDVGYIIRSVTQSAYLGYSLINTSWGKGYAEEAVRAALDIAFRDHGLHRVVAGIEADNRRSIRLAKKIGFRREGVARKIVFLRGKWRDLTQYALTCEEMGIRWKVCKY